MKTQPKEELDELERMKRELLARAYQLILSPDWEVEDPQDHDEDEKQSAEQPHGRPAE